MEDEEDDSKHTYILLSTTVHDGCTSKSGHWFNHCLDVSTGNWYEINDRRIKNSNWNEVQETAGGKTSIRNLLYARKDYFKRLAALIGEDASNDGTQQGANRALLSNITVGTGGDDEFGSGNDGNDDDEDGDSEDGDSDDDKWTEMDNMMHEKLQQMKQHPSKVSLFFCTTQHRRCPWLLPCFFPTPHLTLLPHFRQSLTDTSANTSSPDSVEILMSLKWNLMSRLKKKKKTPCTNASDNYERIVGSGEKVLVQPKRMKMQEVNPPDNVPRRTKKS